jgi:hypothetical protein
MRTLSAVLLALCLLTGACGSSEPGSATKDDGPLVSYAPDGLVKGDVASLALDPESVFDFDAFIVNNADHPVTVMGAKVIALP